MRILIVEDESELAEVLRRMLEQMGNSCRVAPDAAAAETLLRREPVDALTLDLNLPGTPGLAWLEGVARERPRLARRTLVITGGHLDADVVQRVARCGAGVLAKPFTRDGLRTAVRNQIDRPGIHSRR
jgi:DNA-binding response OmpR family regulator